MFTFQRASKAQRKARIGLVGPSGSGKTFTALSIAEGLGGRIALIDTENRSASLYADRFTFDTLQLDTFAPETYVAAIRAAEEAGYEVVIIDSLSHAWAGKDGALEQVDKAAARSRSGNTFAAWREVTPKHNELVDAMIRCKCHLIVTMRAKTEYVIEQVQRNGRTVSEPRKIGMAPIQRDGLEYEFDIVADMDWENRFIVSKTRFDRLAGEVITKPGRELGEMIKGWLSDGAPAQETPRPQPKTQPTQAATGTSDGAAKGGDESKRNDYHAAIAAYLSATYDMDQAQYASFIDFTCDGTPQRCDIDKLAEIARYAYGAAKQGSKTAAEHIGRIVEDWRRASGKMEPDDVPGFEAGTDYAGAHPGGKDLEQGALV